MSRTAKPTSVLSKGSKKLIEEKLLDIKRRIEDLIMAKETYQSKIKEVDLQITQLMGAGREIDSLLRPPAKKPTE